MTDPAGRADPAAATAASPPAPFASAEAFAAVLKPNRAIAGLDLGERTIGIALSDLRRQVATPLETLRRTKFTEDAARLLALLSARGATATSSLPRRSTREPALRRPFAASQTIDSSSAEKKTSAGAPASICRASAIEPA